MAIRRIYDLIISNGRGAFYLFFVTAILLRFFFVSYSPSSLSHLAEDSYPWDKISVLTENNWIYVLVSFVILCFISLFTNVTSVGISLLRERSILPAAFIFLFLSSSILYLSFSSLLVMGLLFSYTLSILYNNYDSENKQQVCLRVGFYLSLGTIFAPALLYFIPLVWLCLYVLRTLNFRGFLAFILGFLPWYILYFAYVAFLNQWSELFLTYRAIFDYGNYSVPILNFDLVQYVFLIFAIIAVLGFILNNKLKGFGEKVIVRICINILTYIQVFSILVMMFIPNGFYTGLTILLITFSLSVSYVYTLTNKKQLLFYLFILNYLSVLGFIFYQLFSV